MIIRLAASSLTAAVVVLLGARVAARITPARAAADRVRPPRWWPIRRGTGLEPNNLEVASWCDGIARQVRSGSSLTAALRDSDVEHPRLAALVGPIAQQIARGRSLGAAVRSAPSDPGSAVALALSVLRSCADLGGPAASPLERVAATLRDREAIREEQQAQSSQAQMSARVMTIVPVGMLGLLACTDANVRAALGTPVGMAALTAGAALNLAGWWWMQRIIGRPR